MRQVVLGLPGQHLLALLVDQVPLVVDQHEGPSGIHRLLDDTHILFGDRLGGIQENDGHLGLLNGALGTQDCVVIGAAGLFHTTANAGGVYEDPSAPVEFEDLIDRVAGRTGDLVDHHPSSPGDGVQQRRLPDVRSAHQGDAVQVVIANRPGDGGHLGKNRHGGVQDIAAAAPVQRGNRVGLAEPQVPQGGRITLLSRRVHLVGGQHDGLARLAQHLHDARIGLGDADLSIDDEHDGVGHVDSDLGLGGDGGIQTGDVHLPTAGVHDGEAPAGPFRRIGDAVASHARRVLNHGCATPQDPVDEGGLADIRSAYDRENRQACFQAGVCRRDVLAVQ